MLIGLKVNPVGLPWMTTTMSMQSLKTTEEKEPSRAEVKVLKYKPSYSLLFLYPFAVFWVVACIAMCLFVQFMSIWSVCGGWFVTHSFLCLCLCLQTKARTCPSD